ncbi:MAG: ADP-ribosylation factor-like protein [Promethearchaeota archaeon]
MKKIPGTLFHLGISGSKDNRFLLSIWYRDQLVYEKTGLVKEAITNEVQFFFESKNLVVPRNRIDWIVNEELSNVSSTGDESFIESTVADLIGEFQKKPTEEMKKIVLIGLSNAGKTCIYERVFEGKKPWELLHSAATKGIVYREYEVGSITKPMIWDLGGQQQYLDEYHSVLRDKIFRSASILLYVIDVTDTDRFENAREELEWSVNQIISFNSRAVINVFFHKIDLVHDRVAVVAYLKKFLSQNLSHKILFHSTSIFGQSLFSAWSEIIREISPKTTFINSILNSLKNHKNIKDVVLLEKSTGLACGSTLEISDEDIAVGMLSLLIVTIDKVTKEMKLQNFKEFKLKTDTNSILVDNVTQDLLLIIILTNADLNSDIILEIEKIGKEVSKQIRNLWIE